MTTHLNTALMINFVTIYHFNRVWGGDSGYFYEAVNLHRLRYLNANADEPLTNRTETLTYNILKLFISIVRCNYKYVFS